MELLEVISRKVITPEACVKYSGAASGTDKLVTKAYHQGNADMSKIES
jgi:hypothetical protein